MKKFIALLLTVFCLTTQAVYAAPPTDNTTDIANALYQFGLFRGTGTDSNGNPIYSLEQSSTRQEAVVMLIRLLGKEIDALTCTGIQPFTDVDGWASRYVAYAYQESLANGVSMEYFGANEKITPQQFITFLLRALGYSEAENDFSYANALQFADGLGLTQGKYSLSGSFTRGDMVWLSSSALLTTTKDGIPLIIELKNNEAISTAQYDAGIHTIATSILADEYRHVKFNGHNVDIATLRETPATGIYDGYVRLRGYTGDNIFQIYFIDEEDIKAVYTPDTSKVVTWHDGKQTRQNTVSECHAFFISGQLRGIAQGNYSSWLEKTFGSVYTDWIFGQRLLEDSAKLLVTRFVNISNGIRYESTEEWTSPEDMLGLADYIGSTSDMLD